jgi:hypothetical protein
MINTVSFGRVIYLLTELSALRAGFVLGYTVEIIQNYPAVLAR